MRDYLLTIKVPLQALDDPAVRELLKPYLEDLNKFRQVAATEIKLQRMVTGKPPEKMEL